MNTIGINGIIYLIVPRYHATKRDLCMLVDMVENSLEHFTTNIVKIYINSIWEVPVNYMYILQTFTFFGTYIYFYATIYTKW